MTLRYDYLQLMWISQQILGIRQTAPDVERQKYMYLCTPATRSSQPLQLPMSSVIIFRLAARIRSQKLFRPHQAGRQLPVLTAALPVSLGCSCFSTSVLRAADKDGQEAADHHEESFEEFTARYVRTHWTKAITRGELGELSVGGIRQRSFGRFQWVMTDPEPSILGMRRSSTPSRMCLNYKCVSIRKDSAPSLFIAG